MSKETDDQKAKYRAEWLNQHGAPKDWIVLTIDEIDILKRELASMTAARDEAVKELELAQTSLQLEIESKGEYIETLANIIARTERISFDEAYQRVIQQPAAHRVEPVSDTHKLPEFDPNRQGQNNE